MDVKIASSSLNMYGSVVCLDGLIQSANSGSVVAYKTAFGYASSTVLFSA